MKHWKFFHGTSEAAYERIKEDGFVVSEPSYYNFLAPTGVYLVANRPLVARRFAIKAAIKALSKTNVVLEVPLKLTGTERVLDLTTDRGMDRLFQAYKKLKGLFSLKNEQLSVSGSLRGLQSYYESILLANQRALEILNTADRARLKDKNRFNWDTAALELLITEDQVQIVVAIVQEGFTLNASFSHSEPKYASIKGYSGIRCRDHIEICVSDLSLIDREQMRVRDAARDGEEFDELFITRVTDIGAMD